MGRHTRKADTYTLPLVETWETSRRWYRRPSRWAWLTKWVRRG